MNNIDEGSIIKNKNKKKVVDVRRVSRGKWLSAGVVGIVGVTLHNKVLSGEEVNL